MQSLWASVGAKNAVVGRTRWITVCSGAATDAATPLKVLQVTLSLRTLSILLPSPLLHVFHLNIFPLVIPQTRY